MGAPVRPRHLMQRLTQDFQVLGGIYQAHLGPYFMSLSGLDGFVYRIGFESVPEASGPFLRAAKTDHSSTRGYVRAPSFVLDQVGWP